MPYGILLLPDEATSERLVAYARAVVGEQNPVMCVSGVLRTHLTLLHVDADADAAAELWRRVGKVLPSEVSVSPSGVQVIPIAAGDYYVPQGGVYVGLEAQRLEDLAHAHRQVADAAADMALPTLSGAGPRFRPHVTLSVLDAEARHVTVPVPSAELLAPFTCRPAWGKLAPYGTFPEIFEA